MPEPAPVVRTGLDVLGDRGFADLHGLRVGLVTHPAAVDRELRHIIDLLSATPRVQLTAVFGPEHGLLGQAQDLVPVPVDGTTQRLRTYSLYGQSVESLRPAAEQLRDLDILVIDLQDVGSRYYTFQATMLYCLEAAARVGLRCMVLDRPNPLGGIDVEGPSLEPGFESFVGPHPIPTRHGLTIGELALLYNRERSIGCDLTVVPMTGWARHMTFDATGLPWVLPSPNMPTLDTAFVYPGMCLIEGTNLSEGRGTTRPFELCGAPWIQGSPLAEKLNAAGLPGVRFRATCFEPTFQKWRGTLCGGVQLHVTDRAAFRPVRVGLHLLAAMFHEEGNFKWRTEPYEFVADRLAIDLLFGSSRERLLIESGASAEGIAGAWAAGEEAFRRRREPFLLY